MLGFVLESPPDGQDVSSASPSSYASEEGTGRDEEWIPPTPAVTMATPTASQRARFAGLLVTPA